MFRYESIKGVLELKPAYRSGQVGNMKKPRKRSISYGEKLKEFTFNNGATLKPVVGRILRI